MPSFVPFEGIAEFLLSKRHACDEANSYCVNGLAKLRRAWPSALSVPITAERFAKIDISKVAREALIARFPCLAPPKPWFDDLHTHIGEVVQHRDGDRYIIVYSSTIGYCILNVETSKLYSINNLSETWYIAYTLLNERLSCAPYCSSEPTA